MDDDMTSSPPLEPRKPSGSSQLSQHQHQQQRKSLQHQQQYQEKERFDQGEEDLSERQDVFESSTMGPTSNNESVSVQVQAHE